VHGSAWAELTIMVGTRAYGTRRLEFTYYAATGGADPRQARRGNFHPDGFRFNSQASRREICGPPVGTARVACRNVVTLPRAAGRSSRHGPPAAVIPLKSPPVPCTSPAEGSALSAHPLLGDEADC
jgi:hypothetical protein